MGYTKHDAKMTQGFAIVCMVVLHLFCRKGSDVLGEPVIWLNDTTPFVYWFGFFAEICVPLYAMCAGYAQQLLLQSGKSSFKDRCKRIGRLMGNYWVVLVLFSILGLIVDPTGNIPGSGFDFVKAVLLIESYNGAWWFLHTYVFLLLLPPKWILFPANNIKMVAGICLCVFLYGGMFLAERLGVLAIPNTHPVAEYILTEIKNLLNVLPYIWLGAIACRHRVIHQITMWWEQHLRIRGKNWLLFVFSCDRFCDNKSDPSSNFNCSHCSNSVYSL